jgi:hypothetical protein
VTIIADGLTKALPKQKFENFVKMVGMGEIKEQLKEEKRKEILKENPKARRSDENPEIVARLTYSTSR